jgi:hypothetical protein
MERSRLTLIPIRNSKHGPDGRPVLYRGKRGDRAARQYALADPLAQSAARRWPMHVTMHVTMHVIAVIPQALKSL